MSAPAIALAIPEPADGGAEPLACRVWRQARNGLDRDRLLPADDKRRRDLAKRLDKPLDRNGWRMFAAGCAWTVENGKAPQRRNAEIQLVETVARWAADVAELRPATGEHLAGLIAAGGPVGALAAYLRDADLPRAAGALLRRHATRIEAPQ